MWKHTSSVLAIFMCLQCGGGTQAATPADEPETEPAAEPETAPEPTPEPESEPTEAEGESPAGATAKKCPELDKSTCQITQGCVWNEIKKCIEEGEPE